MIVPQPWIEVLALHVRAARVDPRPENVHQLRVSAGRLAVWLRLARRRALRDDLAWLRGSAARVRDLDVLLAAHGGAPWARGCEDERAEAARELARVLADPRCDALLAALAFLPPLPRKDAQARLAKLRRRVRQAGERADAAPEPALEELHGLRKRVRRLRYALEWLGRESAAEKALQDALGALCDAAAAEARMRSAGAPCASDWRREHWPRARELAQERA